jgi:hypothetical protein
MKYAMIALAFSASMANAGEDVSPIERKAMKYVPPSEMMLQAFQKVCESDFVLSEKALLACTENKIPKVAKSNEQFRNTGIGAEFNTLLRQL